MKKLIQNKPLDTVISFRVPNHFYKSIKAEAKKIGITFTDYCTATLINEMRTGAIKKDIQERIARQNILWAIFPTGKEVYQGTPEEMKLQGRAYEVSH